MPKLKYAVSESDQLIVRPIAISVIQDMIIDRMALPKDIKIVYPGYTETVTQPHGIISNKFEENRFPTTPNFVLEVTENYVEHLLPSMVTGNNEQIPLFLNRDLEIAMHPIYASMEMRFNIRFRSKDKTEARRVYDRMILKLPDREDVWLHELKYSYPVPESYMVILKAIHEMIEKQDGYGEDFDTWFQTWVNPRWGKLTDQAGKNTLGVFSETQMRCAGFFEEQAAPDWGSRKDETDVWEFTFTYVLRYEKPKDVSFSYPIVIHNQVISRKFRNTTAFERIEDVAQSRSFSMQRMKSLESMEGMSNSAKYPPGRYFPLFDEFVPRMTPNSTMRVFTTLVLLDDENPNHLLNIDDLAADQYGMKVNDCIKDYMRKEHATLTQSRQAAVQIDLYMGRQLMDPSWIEVDENLNIRSTRPLSKRRYYHVRMSVITDFTFMTDAARARLCKYPCVINNIFDYVLPGPVTRPVVPVIEGEVAPSTLDKIAEQLRGRTSVQNMKTVQQTNINAVYQIAK